MKRVFWFLFLGLILLSLSCDKEGVEVELLAGFTQKGPYINGASIQLYELTPSLNQTGNVFETNILDNSGAFEITNVTAVSPYVRMMGSGYYYNEIIGKVSESPLTLYALADIEESESININILTHLERDRVEQLMSNGYSFSKAKDTAQNEVLRIFGFSNQSIQGFELLNITSSNTGDDILLAISVILQAGRSTGELSELLANIITDIREDGVLDNESILDDCREKLISVNLSDVRNNLVNRYQELGLSVSVPDFESRINEFLCLTSSPPTIEILPIEMSESEITFNCRVNPNSSPTNLTVEYGTTAAYGNVASYSGNPLIGNEAVDIQISIPTDGLNLESTYHYQIKAENDKGIVNSNDLSFIYLYYGMEYQGGLVFYIDETGQHGLICAPNDILNNSQTYYNQETGSAIWGRIESDISGAESMEIGNGLANSEAIIASCQDTVITWCWEDTTICDWYLACGDTVFSTWYHIDIETVIYDTIITAAGLCYNLELNGYDDWFLPSASELEQAYINLATQGLGNFNSVERYWTSTALSNNNAYVVSFDNGDLIVLDRPQNRSVRAIRKF